MSIPDETPLFIPDPPNEPLLGTTRARARRSRQGDMMILWIILGVVGLCGVGYAVHLALDSTTPTPPATPPPAIVNAPAATAPDDQFGEDYVQKEALRHELNKRNKRGDARAREAAKAKEEPVVEHIREPAPPPLPPNSAASFESETAFDRPAVDSSRMRRRAGSSREFGTSQAPTPARQPAETSDRPNQPDPSFGEMPRGRTMRKNGARP